MPTVLPIQSRHSVTVQRMPWRLQVRLAILLMRVRWLNRQFEIAHRRVDRYGLDAAGPYLLLTARRWLAAHEAVCALLGCSEPLHVEIVRATLRKQTEADCSIA